MINKLLFEDIVKNALKEDIGTGDITTLSTIPKEQQISGRFIAKEEGIICGLDIVRYVFEILDKDILIKTSIKDGDLVKKGDIFATISGSAINILTGERVALNILQRLSAIATKTSQLVGKVKGTNAKIADTRKTTPMLRVLEKYAVKTGGGVNHRFNLSDGILIKDNHIKAAGGITNAINAARKNAPHTLKIEVEVEDMKQIEEALSAKADIIMLDNMDNEAMRAAVAHIAGRAIVEASGNMDEKDLFEVASTGVDIISIGGLTHTVKAMDISLRLDDIK